MHAVPSEDGKETLITEVAWADPRGSIPHWLLNQLAMQQKDRAKVTRAALEELGNTIM
jgi:hypothetical protein